MQVPCSDFSRPNERLDSVLKHRPTYWYTDFLTFIFNTENAK
jgi:hypothetical protein